MLTCFSIMYYDKGKYKHENIKDAASALRRMALLIQEGYAPEVVQESFIPFSELVDIAIEEAEKGVLTLIAFQS